MATFKGLGGEPEMNMATIIKTGNNNLGCHNRKKLEGILN